MPHSGTNTPQPVEGRVKEKTCCICGCTDSKPCHDFAGHTCAWTEGEEGECEPLCDFCALHIPIQAELLGDPFVEIFSDADLAVAIQQMQMRAAL